jgi:dTDP-4-amino-4,6-dideoxygalactose transaminase
VMRSLAALATRRRHCEAAASCPLREAHAGGDHVRDEVIVPSFIFLAAPAAIVWAGLRPVFVDVDPATFTVDPSAVAAAVTRRTAAVLACHTFGCPCDMDALRAVAGEAGVPLVVDAAHGMGAARDGRQVGAGGLAQVFSLSPTKLVVAGEGGLVATSCTCLADMLRTGREYGNDGAYGCTEAGLNGRLPEISALVARASLARLDEVSARRRAAAAAYVASLEATGLRFQAIPDGCTSSWKDFCVSIDPDRCGIDRDTLRQGLAARGIDTRAYYSPACHRMEAFRRFFPTDGRLPVTDRLADTLLALPMGGHVGADVARRVADDIRHLLTIEGGSR